MNFAFSSRNRRELLSETAEVSRRFVVVAVIAYWFGGFTFYGSVVIPTALKVLGEHRAVGFITQPVTGWLNLIGIITLAALLWNIAASWRGSGHWLRLILLSTWSLIVVLEVSLFAVHPVLDRMLDTTTGAILSRHRFVAWHRAYLFLSTAQWGIMLLHIAAVLLSWRTRDVNTKRSSGVDP